MKYNVEAAPNDGSTTDVKQPVRKALSSFAPSSIPSEAMGQ